jgi:hypothetical protein
MFFRIEGGKYKYCSGNDESEPSITKGSLKIESLTKSRLGGNLYE